MTGMQSAWFVIHKIDTNWFYLVILRHSIRKEETSAIKYLAHVSSFLMVSTSDAIARAHWTALVSSFLIEPAKSFGK